MSQNAPRKTTHGFPLVDADIENQLTREISRLERQVSRLKKHDQFIDEHALDMYEEMLETRRKLLNSLQAGQ